MALAKEIKTLIKKDVIAELRNKSALNGIVLYVVSTVFIAYLIFAAIEDLKTWLSLFWIILLFAATNASINSFRKESGRQFLYYYQLSSAHALIFSKLIFNAILLLVVSFITYGLFFLLLGNPIENQGLFALVLLLGSLSISSILTLTSAIASKTNNNATLTAILSFPIMLPTLLTAIKASILCGVGLGWEDCDTYILTLGLLNIIVLALSYLLFPYLWRS